MLRSIRPNGLREVEAGIFYSSETLLPSSGFFALKTLLALDRRRRLGIGVSRPTEATTRASRKASTPGAVVSLARANRARVKDFGGWYYNEPSTPIAPQPALKHQQRQRRVGHCGGDHQQARRHARVAQEPNR